MEDSEMFAWLACLCIGVIAAALIWHAERKMRRLDEARREAKLAQDRERSAEQLRRSHNRAPIQSLNNYLHNRSSSARFVTQSEPLPSPAPAPSPDYLTQYLAWQYLTTPHASPAPAPDHDSSCRASSFNSGGGGDFGGGGASSSWDSGSSSDSYSSSSSSDSGSSYSSD
jgi:type II secretory pathway pseudopilin PulG